MESSNYDAPGDSEWEGSGELEWTERDWKQFLKESDQEILRFMRVYSVLRGEQDRLDRAAHEMGWDQEDWTTEALFGEDADYDDFDEEDGSDDEDFLSDSEPCTVHRHPLYVTTRALSNLLTFHWGILVQEYPGFASALQSHEFGLWIRQGEINAIMAIHALEMGDYSLVVCHLQRSLAFLNDALGIFQKAAATPDRSLGKHFITEVSSEVFDLREVWLRVMRECRGLVDLG